jgi:DNA-binding response OmpR family regulator
MTGEDGQPLVLVVDDEREVADSYALRLRNRFETETVYSGEAALEVVSDEVDVVLLDRRMPEVTGDEVLAAIRDRGVDVQVIMLTAVDPEFDTLEMPFDDYLCKPVPREDLVAAVEQQLAIVGYRQLSEYFQLAAKRAVLEASTASPAGEHREEYEKLVAETERLREVLGSRIEEFDRLEADFAAVSREPG